MSQCRRPAPVPPSAAGAALGTTMYRDLNAFGPEPLTPLAFLTRSAAVYGDRLALVDGERRWTLKQTGDRTDGPDGPDGLAVTLRAETYFGTRDGA
jgi:hypothetical protein